MNQALPIWALSLTRPWPYAFLLPPSPRGVPPKRVENRSWQPPRLLIGAYLALHAAQSWSESDREFIAETTGLYVPDKSESPHSRIFAVCRVAGHVEHEFDPRLELDQRPWFFGPYGWLTYEFVELKTPVECKGARRLWGFEHKAGLLKELREAYREAREEARHATV